MLCTVIWQLVLDPHLNERVGFLEAAGKACSLFLGCLQSFLVHLQLCSQPGGQLALLRQGSCGRPASRLAGCLLQLVLLAYNIFSIQWILRSIATSDDWSG